MVYRRRMGPLLRQWRCGLHLFNFHSTGHVKLQPQYVRNNVRGVRRRKIIACKFCSSGIFRRIGPHAVPPAGRRTHIKRITGAAAAWHNHTGQKAFDVQCGKVRQIFFRRRQKAFTTPVSHLQAPVGPNHETDGRFFPVAKAEHRLLLCIVDPQLDAPAVRTMWQSPFHTHITSLLPSPVRPAPGRTRLSIHPLLLHATCPAYRSAQRERRAPAAFPALPH